MSQHDLEKSRDRTTYITQ